MRKGTIVPALFLILLGAYLVLKELGTPIPGWEALWPVFPLAGGLASLGNYVFGKQRDPDQVFFGVAAALVGLAFFFITLGPLEYEDLRTWWPVFVLIGSVAFMAQWIAARFHNPTEWYGEEGGHNGHGQGAHNGIDHPAARDSRRRGEVREEIDMPGAQTLAQHVKGDPKQRQDADEGGGGRPNTDDEVQGFAPSGWTKFHKPILQARYIRLNNIWATTCTK